MHSMLFLPPGILHPAQRFLASSLFAAACCGSLAPLAAAPVAPLTPAPALLNHITHAFFDDTSGGRLGQLQIERARVEPGRHGFLRVAWRPVLVLEGVTLSLTSAAGFPAAGEPIRRAFAAFGHPQSMVFRGFVLQLPGRGEIRAAQARLRADGALELFSETPAAREPRLAEPALVFWLPGPHAGQLTPAAPGAAPLATTRSTPAVGHQNQVQP